MPLSTSSGDAPGYTTVTKAISSLNSGKVSRRIAMKQPTPTAITASRIIFTPGVFLTAHSIYDRIFSIPKTACLKEYLL
jgi:hypothetical protein